MGDNLRALACGLGMMWQRDPGFVRSHISSAYRRTCSKEQSGAFLVFLDKKKGAGAGWIPIFYAFLSAALKWCTAIGQ